VCSTSFMDDMDLFSMGEISRRTCDRWLICSSRCYSVFTFDKWMIYMAGM
jgi:hypothetical protein